MGAFGSRLFPWFGPREMCIMMLGFDGAGKTTILYRLKLGEVVATIPTIGFNVETVKYKHISLTVWDGGGQDKIRPVWRSYFHHAQGLIWVIDSTDTARAQEAAEELHRTVQNDNLRNAPVLVLANKQDLPNAMDVETLVTQLRLHQVIQPWQILVASAATGDGLYDGLDWMVKAVQSKRSTQLQ